MGATVTPQEMAQHELEARRWAEEEEPWLRLLMQDKHYIEWSERLRDESERQQAQEQK